MMYYFTRFYGSHIIIWFNVNFKPRQTKKNTKTILPAELSGMRDTTTNIIVVHFSDFSVVLFQHLWRSSSHSISVKKSSNPFAPNFFFTAPHIHNATPSAAKGKSFCDCFPCESLLWRYRGASSHILFHGPHIFFFLSRTYMHLLAISCMCSPHKKKGDEKVFMSWFLAVLPKGIFTQQYGLILLWVPLNVGISYFSRFSESQIWIGMPQAKQDTHYEQSIAVIFLPEIKHFVEKNQKSLYFILLQKTRMPLGRKPSVRIVRIKQSWFFRRKGNLLKVACCTIFPQAHFCGMAPITILVMEWFGCTVWVSTPFKHLPPPLPVCLESPPPRKAPLRLGDVSCSPFSHTKYTRESLPPRLCLSIHLERANNTECTTPREIGKVFFFGDHPHFVPSMPT